MLALMLFFVHLKKMRKKRTAFFASLCWEEYYMHQFSHDLHRLLNVQKNGSPAAGFLLFFEFDLKQRTFIQNGILYAIPFWMPPSYGPCLVFSCSFLLFAGGFVCLLYLYDGASILRPFISFSSIHFGWMPVLFVGWFFQKEKSNDWDNTRTHTRTQHCCI